MNTIDQLAAAYEAKKIESARIAAELNDAHAALIAAIEHKDEGTTRAFGSAYKVTVEFSMNRTIDVAALEAVREKVAPALFEQAVEYKPAINLRGLRYLRNNEPDTYAVLAQAITAKPAKPSVRIEAFERAREAA